MRSEIPSDDCAGALLSAKTSRLSAPGAELYSAEHAISADDQALQVIDLSGAGISAPGPYRVGIEFQHAAEPSVARDDDGITPSRNFVETGGSGWVEASVLGVTGDWIIRSTVGESTAVPGLAGWAVVALTLALGALGSRAGRRKF